VTALALTRRRAPRTQAERSATTRARIVRAVVECVNDLGFQQTTTTAIARRAGVTWGAVQHHFGGKDGILGAVLDDTFARFAQRFDDLPADLPLPVRASRFVACAWAHFGSRHYRTTLEILLHYLPSHTAKGDYYSRRSSMPEALRGERIQIGPVAAPRGAGQKRVRGRTGFS